MASEDRRAYLLHRAEECAKAAEMAANPGLIEVWLRMRDDWLKVATDPSTYLDR